MQTFDHLVNLCADSTVAVWCHILPARSFRHKFFVETPAQHVGCFGGRGPPVQAPDPDIWRALGDARKGGPRRGLHARFDGVQREQRQRGDTRGDAAR